MTKGLNEHEPNGRDVYSDIIDHPHWQSKTRKHMSLHDRAAQFSPFDALTGYSDMVREEQRLTEEKIQPTEAQMEILDRKLNRIQKLLEQDRIPSVTIAYFEQDPFKSGGSYRTVTARIRKIDPNKGVIVLLPSEDITDTEILISDILDME